ncbi:hypothetical protein RDWZM_009947 [Blomia tropicalis]|uniref:Uncharacterized protein n=1 Tax=Blomia tropicalis TaxID=40697 RepID=A0A9Q0M125_BLOTA|nr:hypothetical protein RDWZM_009947 [Blomia tropicalis]
MANRADFNDPLEDITFAEQRRHRQMGFTRGYSIGEEAGWRDGYIFGMRKGAQLSAEIGYYQGFAHAWITLLEREDVNKQRKLNALNTLLEMTRAFPKANTLMEDDTIQKLARIRAKFKQVNALIHGGGASYVIHSNGTTGNVPSSVHHSHGTGTGSATAAAAGGGGGGGIGHQNVFRGASWTSQDSGAGSYGTGSMRGISPNIPAGSSSHGSTYGNSGVYAGLGPKTEMSF